MIIYLKTWYLYSKGECDMDIIGKIISFVMSTISNFIGSGSMIEHIKNAFNENFKKDN